MVHRFAFYPTADRQPISRLQGAYLIGTDGVPVRGDFELVEHEIRCTPRLREPVGLSLLWLVEGFGRVQLETTRLPVREEPYHLHVELARSRLLRITLKREEWGLFDYNGMDEIAREVDAAHKHFVDALKALDEPEKAARLADESLRVAMWASEKMAQFHAGVFLGRRQQGGGFGSPFCGVVAPPVAPNPAGVRRICEAFDFVRIPFTWREMEPKEQATSYSHTDAWVKACQSARLTVHGGPLLSFGVRTVPDWMYIWENDFETIVDYAKQHVRRTVKRYANKVSCWTVTSGLYADNVFSFNFEQIMEMTRMAATVTKQLAPRSQVILDLTQPWGEYYARNQRSIPPLLYAEMALQSGVPFDGFGLQFLFGLGSAGFRTRDLLQVSALVDKLANLGRTLHITALAAPSQPPDDEEDGGRWHKPWSDESQAEWLVALAEIGLSKPYVESICLHTLADGTGEWIPASGVLRPDNTAKPAFHALERLRKRLASRPSR